MCRAFLAQLRELDPELQAMGVEVVAMTLGEPEATKEFCHKQGVDFACLCDPERQSYEAYGLANSMIGASHPSTWWAYTREIVKGNLPGLTTDKGAGSQLSGTFIIDQAGTVRFAHRNKTAADYPAPETILAAARALSATEIAE